MRAVVFDAVGTLIFPDPGAPVVYAEYARRHGAEVSPELVRKRMVAAYRLEEEIDRAAGWVTSEEREHERWRRIVTVSLPELADPAVCFRDLFEHFARPESWRINPDAAAAFSELARRGVRAGLGSNYDSRLLRVLAGKPELEPVRDFVVVSSLVGWRKPSPRFFAEVVRLAGADYPGEVVFVGDDRGNDFEGATAAGLRAMHYGGVGSLLPGR